MCVVHGRQLLRKLITLIQKKESSAQAITYLHFVEALTREFFSTSRPAPDHLGSASEVFDKCLMSLVNLQGYDEVDVTRFGMHPHASPCCLMMSQLALGACMLELMLCPMMSKLS